LNDDDDDEMSDEMKILNEIGYGSCETKSDDDDDERTIGSGIVTWSEIWNDEKNV
jgi:hypothetical protein